VLGAITGRDVLRNTTTIVREFGPAAYARCVLAVATGHPRTFLAAVTASASLEQRQRRRAVLALAVALLASASVAVTRPAGEGGGTAGCIAACEAPGHPSRS
jgi:hypothetical protein